MKKWRIEESGIKLTELDFKTSPGHVIQRRNIIEKEIDIEGEISTVYECEMKFLTIQEYTEEMKLESDEIKQLMADLSEIVLMGGIF